MKNLILLLLVSIVLISCASTKQFKKFPDNEPLKENMARIYLVRTGNFGGFVKFNVFLDSTDNLVGIVGPNGYLCFDTFTGEHKIIVKAETERLFTINAQPDKIYYLRLVPTMGVSHSRVDFEILDEVEGNKVLNKLKPPKMYYME